MNEEIKYYLDKYPTEVVTLFYDLREIIYDCTKEKIEEKMWAKLPSYYVGEKWIRLIVFKDHVNIEALTIKNHLDELRGYKVTPKGMLQIRLSEAIPKEVLNDIFRETLEN